MAKKMEIAALGIAATAHNKREESLVRITNNDISRIINDWKTSGLWSKSFEEDQYEHWRFKELDGVFSAMYWLDMIVDPVSDITVYRAVKALV